MDEKHVDSTSAMRRLAGLCGVLAGLGGVTHAVGEVRQGNGSLDGLVFDSWVDGRLAANLGGEPAMTALPTTASAGIATFVASAAVIACSLVVLRGYAGGVLIALSLVMMVVGGGFGPPILGVLAGGVAIGAGSPLRRWRSLLDGSLGRRLAALWPTLFWLSAANAVLLVVGSLIMGYVLDIAVPDVFVSSLFLAVLALPLATLAGLATRVRDASELVPR